jgi:hypothetical protein
MKLRSFILIFFVVLLIFGFTRITTAQIKLTIKDKREIIKLILQKQSFDDALYYVSDGTLFLSTENIPIEIQKNFPNIRGVKFQFVTPEYIDNATVKINYFAFTEFKIKKKSVEVSFVEYDLPDITGRGFSCRKINGKWKIKVNKISLSMT